MTVEAAASGHGNLAHGQGHDTAWSMIVADQLGIAIDGSR